MEFKDRDSAIIFEKFIIPLHKYKLIDMSMIEICIRTEETSGHIHLDIKKMTPIETTKITTTTYSYTEERP